MRLANSYQEFALMADAKHTPLFNEAELSMMDELQNTKLPRHHRDAQDAMSWAAEEIQRLRTEKAAAPDLLAVCLEMLELEDNWPGIAYTYDLSGRARAAIAKATGAA
jgi:hypothetical protein